MALGLTAALGTAPALAGQYVPILNPVQPVPGVNTVPPPDVVPGKEYSHEPDRSSTVNGTAPDAQQNTTWDGSGGVADTFDYDGVDEEDGAQVDAIANARDVLFQDVIENNATLLYSLRQGPNIQGQGVDVGPPVWFEKPSGSTGTWATWPQVDQHGGDNLDALEVWGGELQDDADKYSLFGDWLTGVSVYNLDGSTYITHGELAREVNQFFQSVGILNINETDIDVDAMMVDDLVTGDPNLWEDGDWLLFSLWPIDGVLVGDLALVWQRGVSMSWLHHGGDLWNDGWLGTNVDALEAVPVPATLALFGIGALGLGLGYRRRRPADDEHGPLPV